MGTRSAVSREGRGTRRHSSAKPQRHEPINRYAKSGQGLGGAGNATSPPPQDNGAHQLSRPAPPIGATAQDDIRNAGMTFGATELEPKCCEAPCALSRYATRSLPPPSDDTSLHASGVRRKQRLHSNPLLIAPARHTSPPAHHDGATPSLVARTPKSTDESAELRNLCFGGDAARNALRSTR